MAKDSRRMAVPESAFTVPGCHGAADYSLRAVVFHQGTEAGGHYICNRKKEGRWWRCSDESVWECSWERVKEESEGGSCMLFFERVTKEETAKAAAAA